MYSKNKQQTLPAKVSVFVELELEQELELELKLKFVPPRLLANTDNSKIHQYKGTY